MRVITRVRRVQTICDNHWAESRQNVTVGLNVVVVIIIIIITIITAAAVIVVCLFYIP